MANNVSLSYPSSFYNQFFDRNGKPLTSGKLYTYIAGSTNPVVTYKTIVGGTETSNRNTNPIILDMAGMAELVISTDTAYKFVLFDRNDTKIAEWDNVTAGGSEGGVSSNVYVAGTRGEIDVEEESAGPIRRFIVSLSDSVKNAISDLSSSVGDIVSALSQKKDKQQPVTKLGSTTKVPVSFAQDANGKLDIEFDDIMFPDWTSAINNAVANREKTSNKKNSVTGYESSTSAYPSIKAVVDFVNSIMQNLGGKLITDNGNPFSDSDDLPSTTPYQGVTISDKDYAYVQGTGFAERWSASVSGSDVTWVQEYSINIPVFTPAQQAAIDSGATATKIGNYDSHIANATIHVTLTDKNTWNAKQNAIIDLAEIRSGAAAGATALQPNGNGSNVTSTFTTASFRTNISSGEKLSTIFGKIAKWFSDLKALAFKDNVSNSDISGTIADAHIASASTWNHKQNALPTSGTPSSTFAINVSGTARYSENVLPYYVSTDNDKSWLEVGTYKANNTDEMYTGITFAVKFRSVDGRTQSGFVWISVGEWKSEGGYSNEDIVCEYYTLGRRVKEPSDSVKLYVNILGTYVTDGVKIYAYLAGYSNISLTPLNVNKGTYTSSMTYLDAEPATKKEVTYCNLIRSTYGTSIGGATSPIYADQYGILRECDPMAKKASSGNGNLAVIDSSGNYASSGISAYSQSQLNAAVENNVFPWLFDNSYVMTRSFWLTATTSVTGKVMDFVNLYTGEKLLRIGFNYVNDGDLQIYIPWNNDQWNQWIVETSGSSEVGYAFVTANGTKHSDNAGADTITPYFAQNESTLHSSGQSASVIGNYSIGTSTLYNTSSHYNFCIMLGNAESGKLVRLNLSAATKRYASGAKKAEIMVFATLDASGLND